MASEEVQSDLDVPTQKMLNYISALKSKNEKQSNEISRLKGEVARAKSAHSRIRRIPKKGGEESKAEEAKLPESST